MSQKHILRIIWSLRKFESVSKAKKTRKNLNAQELQLNEPVKVVSKARRQDSTHDFLINAINKFEFKKLMWSYKNRNS